MIKLDNGGYLKHFLSLVARDLDIRDSVLIAVPFIEVDSQLWRGTLKAAISGVSIYLITREPADRSMRLALTHFRSVGGHLTFLNSLHAKVICWHDASQHRQVAYIGSTNFTFASEQLAHELGVVIAGSGVVEHSVFRDIRSFIARLRSVARSGKQGRKNLGCRGAESCH